MTTSFVVHDAQRKLQAIAECLAELGHLTDSHMSTLLTNCQPAVVPNTFKSAIYSGRLSKVMCAELSRLCSLVGGDPIDLLRDETFIDVALPADVRDEIPNPDYPGRDSAGAFTARLRSRLGLSANVQIKAVTSVPKLVDENLFQFEIDDAKQVTELGRPLQMFLSAVADIKRDMTGVEFGFNRIRLSLRLDETPDLRIEGRLDGVQIREAHLTVEGRSKGARWTLRAPDGEPLRGEYSTTEAPLCVLENVLPGTTFSGIASVNLLEPGAVVVSTPEPVQNATREIVKRLMERSIDLENESGGWKTLAVQQVRVVKV